MQPTIPIAELQPGQYFKDFVYVVSNAEHNTDKNGRSFIAMVLSDATGRRKARWFKTTPENWAEIQSARFISVGGSVQKGGNFEGELSIASAAKVAEPEDLSPYLPPMRETAPEQQKYFQETIKSVREPNLRRLLEAVYDPQTELWRNFTEARAATSMHHAYRGGLLDHTLEVARLCDAVCTVLSSLRRDFLVTCALLHDIGKLEEMEHGLTGGEYTSSGNLVGHVVLGTYTVIRKVEDLEDFPIDLRDGIMHLILSHHGKLEFGAARLPACAEAQVLAECDLISARVDQCVTAKEDAAPGQSSVRLRSWEGGKLNIGDFGLQEPALEEIQSDETEPDMASHNAPHSQEQLFAEKEV